jgi:hypothetical protein
VVVGFLSLESMVRANQTAASPSPSGARHDEIGSIKP